MAIATIDTRRFTREEYERLVEQGFFHPEEKLELIEGVIYEMTPQSSYHATGVRMAERALSPFYEHGFDIRCQLPLALGLDSEPEPDIAIVTGKPEDYLASHPATAALVVEVADSSLIHDRKRKIRLYARAGIPDYWLTNLVDWRLEVYRDPKEGGYQTCTVLRPGDSIAPLAKPDLEIPVSDLLPFSGK